MNFAGTGEIQNDLGSEALTSSQFLKFCKSKTGYDYS